MPLRQLQVGPSAEEGRHTLGLVRLVRPVPGMWAQLSSSHGQPSMNLQGARVDDGVCRCRGGGCGFMGASALGCCGGLQDWDEDFGAQAGREGTTRAKKKKSARARQREGSGCGRSAHGSEITSKSGLRCHRLNKRRRDLFFGLSLLHLSN
jgi:hypothetical protein